MTVMTKQIKQPTKYETISAKSATVFLRATKHRLYSYKSEGRYICRVVNKHGKIAGISSSSTLEEAVTIAVRNVQS